MNKDALLILLKEPQTCKQKSEIAILLIFFFEYRIEI